MTEVAIRVDGLSKQYQIGQGAQAPYDTLREHIMRALRAPISGIWKSRSTSKETTIWALKDVSFEIRQGDVIGIIGRNGAGKSTLLKILSRITEPTKGSVDLYGRVGSLLEVGTGFHPELTGRENIYLNGAILGMRRAEIAAKFDEIVAFSEIEKFIDTPVKFYSSGMYMRLAFSVAAHLEPEILLVDEVLAVGDAAFQKKCLGKMGEVARQGRTVLFVSHQMNAVQTLCPQSLWLADGQLVERGDTKHVISRYLSSGTSKYQWLPEDGRNPAHNPFFNPFQFALVDTNMALITRDLRADEKLGILIEGIAEQTTISLSVGFAVYATNGELLFWAQHTDLPEEKWPPIHLGKNRLIAWVPEHLLNEGDYRIELMISLHFQEWFSQPGVNAPSLELTVRGGLSESPYWMMVRPGLLAPIIPFEALDVPEGAR